jgi:hypothetical protein
MAFIDGNITSMYYLNSVEETRKLFAQVTRPLSLLVKNFRIALAWAVTIRLHVCSVHAVIGVEYRERESAHNPQARRGCIIAVNVPRSPRTCGHAAQF